MMFMCIFNLISASLNSQRPSVVPTLFLTRSRVSPLKNSIFPSMNDHHSFFEKIFMESSAPIIFRKNIENNEIPSNNIFKSSYNNSDKYEKIQQRSKTLEERVKNKNNITEEATNAYKCTTSHSAGFLVLLLVIVMASGVVGYYTGKAAESRNYIRVPSTN